MYLKKTKEKKSSTLAKVESSFLKKQKVKIVFLLLLPFSSFVLYQKNLNLQKQIYLNKKMYTCILKSRKYGV